MRAFVAIVLFTLLMLPTALKVNVFVDYVVNFDTYAYELCINQDKEAFQCDGKCQLMQNMAEFSESKEKSEHASVVMEFEFQPMVVSAAQLHSIELNAVHSDRFVYTESNSVFEAQELIQPPVV